MPIVEGGKMLNEHLI